MPKITATIHLKTRQEVEDMIDELRNALKRSEQSGGAYHASMEDVDARVIFRVHVPAKARARLPKRRA